MCDTLRNTDSRGRSDVPRIRLRMRNLIRSRRSSFVLICITRLSPGLTPRHYALGSCLAGLLLQLLARVAHALLLIRVGLAQTAQIRGDLAHELTIDARDRDVRLLLDR